MEADDYKRRAIIIATLAFTAIVVLVTVFGEETIYDTVYQWCCS